jgi:hypothetical protein
MPLRVPLAIGRLLMKTHGVGKRHPEERVIAPRELLQHAGQQISLTGSQFVYGGGVPIAEDELALASIALPSRQRVENRNTVVLRYS